MNSSDHFSQRDFDSLLALIGKEECAVFIGAGLSIPIGYPSLQDLLQEMAQEANIAGLTTKEIDKNWRNDFQNIKNALGEERYRGCIGRIFDHTKRTLKFNPILLNILNIPFCAYVTTNYDPCLEFATRNLPALPSKYSFSYPELPTSELKGKHIFHPHGYIKPEDPNSVNSIILSEDEFTEAYEVTTTTSTFFRASSVRSFL